MSPTHPEALEQAAALFAVRLKDPSPILDQPADFPVDEVLAYVGRNATKARHVLELERASGSPRAQLIEQLSAVLAESTLADRRQADFTAAAARNMRRALRQMH